MNTNTHTMQAVVYTAPNEMTFMDSYCSKQTARDDDVLLKINAVGICGSDMHAYHGHDPRRNPGLILGHEFCGQIMSGDDQGQLVTGNPLITCGVCQYCQQGRDNLCNNRDMIGMNRQGAFAQFMEIPKQCLIKVPQTMNPNHVALTEPAATAMHAVNMAIKASFKPVQACQVLVIGAGAIGLLSALLLKHHGVNRLSILETNLVRHQCVKEQIGVSALNPLKEAVDTDAFDIVFDCVGSAATRKQAFSSVSAGGIITHVGLQDWASEIDMRKLTLQEITLIGCYTYTMLDFKNTVDALYQGMFGDLSWIQEIPLVDAPQAFRDLDAGKLSSAKIVLKPHID